MCEEKVKPRIFKTFADFVAYQAQHNLLGYDMFFSEPIHFESDVEAGVFAENWTIVRNFSSGRHKYQKSRA